MVFVGASQNDGTWAKWSHYKPRSMRVYGAICESPASTYLLVRGVKAGKWGFPKGHLKEGELGQACALRELREETGLVLAPYSFYATQKLFAGEYFCYRVNEQTLEPEDTHEIDAIGWFTPEEMAQMDVNADVKRFLTMTFRGRRWA